MKTRTLTSRKLWLPVLAVGAIVAFASWDSNQAGYSAPQQTNPTDTLPKKKKNNERKARDLDEVIAELDAVDIKKEMEQAQVEITKAMKEFDGAKLEKELTESLKEIDAEKIQAEIAKAMQSVDLVKMKEQLTKSLNEIDLEKMKKQLQESIAQIDMEKLKHDMADVQKIDMSKMKVEMEKVKEQMANIRPELEKNLSNMKIDMHHAEEEIAKARAEMREYKTFVDGLDADGLISKKTTYSLKHSNGELLINGKKASAETYQKYKSFLEKHTKFNIEKSNDDFDIHTD
jgi:hypothetical protein